jgi:hypothetical protein
MGTTKISSHTDNANPGDRKTNERGEVHTEWLWLYRYGCDVKKGDQPNFKRNNILNACWLKGCTNFTQNQIEFKLVSNRQEGILVKFQMHPK